MIHPDARSSCISVIVNTAVRGSNEPKETKVGPGKGKSFQLEKKSHVKPNLMRETSGWYVVTRRTQCTS